MIFGGQIGRRDKSVCILLTDFLVFSKGNQSPDTNLLAVERAVVRDGTDFEKM